MSTSLVMFALVAVVFAAAFVGLAIGVIVSNRRVQGSCGGLANMKDDKGNPMCMACDTPPEDCLREAQERADAYAAQQASEDAVS